MNEKIKPHIEVKLYLWTNWHRTIRYDYAKYFDIDSAAKAMQDVMELQKLKYAKLNDEEVP